MSAQPEDDVRFQQAVAVGAVQKGRHPDLESAEREGHHRHAESCGEKCGIANQALQRVALWELAFGRIELAQRRLWDQQQQQGQQNSGRGSHVERNAPAVLWTHDAAQQIAPARFRPGSRDRTLPSPGRAFPRETCPRRRLERESRSWLRRCPPGCDECSSSSKFFVKAVSRVAPLHTMAPATMTRLRENRSESGPMKGAAHM